jgi:hypothetical protein
VFIALDETLAIEGNVRWANLVAVKLRRGWVSNAEEVFEGLCMQTRPAFGFLSDSEEWAAHAIVENEDGIIGAPGNHPLEPPYILARTYLSPRYRPHRLASVGVSVKPLGEGVLVGLGALTEWRSERYRGLQRASIEALKGAG